MGSRVLVLDDDDDMREALQALIEFLGSECVGARSVEDMIKRRDGVLDCGLAILDINLGYGMPSGIDAYHWLHCQSYGGVVVFLTGHARTHPLVLEACRLREARLLEKPVGMRELQQILAKRSV